LLFYTDETVKVANALANGMKIPNEGERSKVAR